MRVGSGGEEFAEYLVTMGNGTQLIHEEPDYIAIRDDCLREIGKDLGESMRLCVE